MKEFLKDWGGLVWIVAVLGVLFVLAGTGIVPNDGCSCHFYHGPASVSNADGGVDGGIGADISE